MSNPSIEVAASAPKKRVKSTYYIKNSELLIQIQRFKDTCKYDEAGKYIPNSGRMDNILGGSILKISKGLCTKGNYSGYTWTEDMVAEGVLTVCKYMHNFNPEKSNNPFAYITQICNHAFKNYLKNQKKHAIIKEHMSGSYDELLDNALSNKYINGFNDEEFSTEE